MRVEEVREAGRIAGSVSSGSLGLVRDVHLSVADRVFRAVGPFGEAVRPVHHGVAQLMYGAAQQVQRWGPQVVAAAGSLAVAADSPSLDTSPRGNVAVGAINGLWGDHLAAAESELAVDMTVRSGGVDVSIDRVGLSEAFPEASGRVAVFLHGLCETEHAWWPSARRQRRSSSINFGDRLVDVGFTPVYLRYNSGLHISDNGSRLSVLLDELVAEWPVPISEIILIGHSMGGLLARSAAHHADLAGARWVEQTRHVFGLGTPHLGAPLERAVNAIAWSFHQIPETRGIASVLNARSVGVKDLRFGSLLEDDWRGVDLDGLLTGAATEVPFSPHINYYFVGATLTRSRHHPLGVVAGDLLVQLDSASGSGRRRRLPFSIDNGRHLGGLDHFDLLTHPDVYAHLEEWLATSNP